jgi:hypothetical protein
MREWDKDAVAVRSALSDDLAQRDTSPESLDRKRPNEQDHTRMHERELCVEPRCA